MVDGVSYVNDSKATNVDATLKALTAYSGDVHLILGGYDKGAEYGELAAATEGRVKQALLIGATAPQLEAAFSGACDRGRRTADSVRPLRRPRGGGARRGCLRRAGRRRPAQPSLRELGPVQGLRAARRTFPETGERPENEELRPREVVRTRGRARRSRPPRLGRGRAAACEVGRGPPVLRAAERGGPGPGPGATRHRTPLGGAARSCRLLDPRRLRKHGPRLRESPPRAPPDDASRGQAAGDRPRARRRRAPRADAGDVPARRLRARHGLQRLVRRGLLPARQQLLLLRPPGRVGLHRDRHDVRPLQGGLRLVPQGRRSARRARPLRPPAGPGPRRGQRDQRRPPLAHRRRPGAAAQRVRQAGRRGPHRGARRQAAARAS